MIGRELRVSCQKFGFSRISAGREKLARWLDANFLAIIHIPSQSVKPHARRIARASGAAERICGSRAPLAHPIPLLEGFIQTGFALRSAGAVGAFLAGSCGTRALPRPLRRLHTLCLLLQGEAHPTAVIQKRGLQQASAAAPNLPGRAEIASVVDDKSRTYATGLSCGTDQTWALETDRAPQVGGDLGLPVGLRFRLSKGMAQE
jgi:hypothetical protein